MGPAPSPATKASIGVDLGGTKMRVGAVDDSPRIVWRAEESSLGLGTEELLATLRRQLEDAAAANPGALAVGLGVPCRIVRETGVAIGAVNLPIADLPLRDVVGEWLDAPVFVDNDANVAAIAEHRHGAARGAHNVLMLTIGTGVGGGLILGDRVYRGATGAGAEIGHIVVELDGPPCQGSCPNRGCLEAVASGLALAREGNEAASRHPDSALGRALAAGEEITGRSVTDAALAGDAVSLELVDALGRRLGAALSGLANVFEPEVIVLGGGVMAVGDLLLEPAREELAARALEPMRRTPLVPAELGGEAGVIGAATMALLELEGGS
jgi:glucokinase